MALSVTLSSREIIQEEFQSSLIRLKQQVVAKIVYYSSVLTFSHFLIFYSDLLSGGGTKTRKKCSENYTEMICELLCLLLKQCLLHIICFLRNHAVQLIDVKVMHALLQIPKLHCGKQLDWSERVSNYP